MTLRAFAADCQACVAYRERFGVVPDHYAAHRRLGDCGHEYCRAYQERFGVWPVHAFPIPLQPEEP